MKCWNSRHSRLTHGRHQFPTAADGLTVHYPSLAAVWSQCTQASLEGHYPIVFAAAFSLEDSNGLIYCGTSSLGNDNVETTPGTHALCGIASVGPSFATQGQPMRMIYYSTSFINRPLRLRISSFGCHYGESEVDQKKKIWGSFE